MYFNFCTDPYSPFYVLDEDDLRRASPEERERRLNWHLPPARRAPPPQRPQEWRGEPWDDSQDAGLDFAQEDPGVAFDAADDGFDLPPDYGWPDDWPPAASNR
ncbi:MAG: hypothetical protein ACK4NA_12910 [Alphaproteobacteria bacterium]